MISFRKSLGVCLRKLIFDTVARGSVDWSNQSCDPLLWQQISSRLRTIEPTKQYGKLHDGAGVMGSGDDRQDLQLKSPNMASLNHLTRLAHEHLQKGDLQTAMKHFETAVEQSKSVEDASVRVSCYLNAGACLVSLGQYKRGLSFLESASDIIKTFEESSGVGESVQMLEMSADVHYNTAVAAQGLREYEKAVASFKSCIRFYAKAGSKGHAAEAFSSLASCHGEAGSIDKQLACLTSAQQLYNELGDCSNEAVTYVELAKAYLSSEKEDECKQMLSTAKMMCLRVDDAKIQGIPNFTGIDYGLRNQYNDNVRVFNISSTQ